MKNDLTCAVVRDLLPSFVEGLTEEETSEAVEHHLVDCPQCRRLRRAMDLDAQTDAREEKEVDYLKQVKRQEKRRMARAVLLTLTIVGLILGGIALELFVVGDEATSEGMSWSIQQDGNYLNVRAYTAWSGVAYCRWETEQVGDTVYIRTTKVLPSYLYPTAEHRTAFSLQGVKTVYLAERVIWQDGVTIWGVDEDLLEKKVDFVGDAPALGELAKELGLQSSGTFTSALKTDAPPYRWTVEYSGGNAWQIHEDMSVNAFFMLALVGNLEEAAWIAPDGTQGLLTLAQANERLAAAVEAYNEDYGENWAPPDSIKDWASLSGMSRLRHLTDYMANA